MFPFNLESSLDIITLLAAVDPFTWNAWWKRRRIIGLATNDGPPCPPKAGNTDPSAS